MTCYRLIIRQHQKLLGHFDSEVPAATQALRSLIGQLPASDGFTLELWRAQGEKRVLESSPNGVRLLGREPYFEAVPLSTLLPETGHD